MLSGKVGKAFEPNPHRPAKDLGKHRRQDREEHYGEDRGEHRGASRGTGGNGFLGSLIAGSCWQLIDTHFKRKSGCKSACKSGCKRHCQRLAIDGVKDRLLTVKDTVNV